MDTSMYKEFLLLLPAMAFLIIIICLELFMKGREKRAYKLPPGPKGWPIVGNMQVMGGQMPHKDLALLSTNYGPLLYLQLGSRPAVVASSAKWASEILHTHDKELGSRPSLAIFEDWFLGNLAFVPLGDYWRQMRKLVVVDLLSPINNAHAWQGVRMEEICRLLLKIRQNMSSSLGKERYVGIRKETETIMEGLMGRLLFSLELKEEVTRLKGFIEKANQVLAGLIVGDFIPYLGFLDVLSHARRRRLWRSLIAFIQQVLRIRQSQLSESECEDEVKEKCRPQCFMDLLLAMKQHGHLIDNRDEVLTGLLKGLFAAGIETTSSTLEWAMVELMTHPYKLKKVRDEMERELVVVGGVLEDEQLLGRLKYLECVVKETLRLHPPVPLLIPRESMERCVVGEEEKYELPKGTMVYINVWAIGRDPELWENPEEFLPERFSMALKPSEVSDEKELASTWQQENMLAFGGGRRGCPGKALALTTIQLILANLLFSFNWKTGEDYPSSLNMDEKFGAIVMAKATPLMLIPTPRCTNI